MTDVSRLGDQAQVLRLTDKETYLHHLIADAMPDTTDAERRALAQRLGEHLHVWQVHYEVAKREGDWTGAQIDAGDAPSPYEVRTGDGNLLMYGGASCLWQCLTGNGTGTTGQTLTFFNNDNAYIGVGDSSTAAAATQTDLQAASNKLRKAMDSTYPQHTDATTSGAATITFRSTFGTSEANFAWAEWAIFNGSSGGRMLNRKVESLGTKASGTWTLTLTLTLA